MLSSDVVYKIETSWHSIIIVNKSSETLCEILSLSKPFSNLIVSTKRGAKSNRQNVKIFWQSGSSIRAKDKVKKQVDMTDSIIMRMTA